MRSVQATVHIDSDPVEVWLALTDFASYPEWNPFITAVQGQLRPGRRLSLRLVPEGKPEYSFHPRVLSVTPGEQFCWLGRTLFPWILDGFHCFHVEPDEPGARFTQREDFHGVLVAPLWSRVGHRIEGGMRAMNSALKDRLEGHEG